MQLGNPPLVLFNRKILRSSFGVLIDVSVYGANERCLIMPNVSALRYVSQRPLLIGFEGQETPSYQIGLFRSLALTSDNVWVQAKAVSAFLAL